MAGISRLLVVEHPGIGKYADKICVHSLLNNYHWAMLSTTHILVAATYPIVHHAKLLAHSRSLVLPSHARSQTIHACAAQQNKLEHYQALVDNVGVQTTWTTSDLLEIAINIHGIRFEPSYM